VFQTLKLGSVPALLSAVSSISFLTHVILKLRVS
jgi:hypothetical protein